MIKKNDIPIKKIVYFDEGSAIDYLDITHGGLKTSIEEKQATTTTTLGADVEGIIGTGIAFKAISPFFKIEADGKAGAGISRIGDSIVGTIISNTVLSDFIKIADRENSIKHIKNYEIKAYPNSISYIKMYTPYLSMLNLDNEAVNFSKIDEVLERGKGYYELIAENTEEKLILRFNIKAFRNNYSLVDLTKMDLEFYVIQVGKMNIADLDAKREFSSIGNGETVTVEDILKGSGNPAGTMEAQTDDSIVYDVILAGIGPNE